MNALLDDGIMAFRAGNFSQCIEHLMRATEEENPNWLARMYLGMCYAKCGRTVDAYTTYHRLWQDCPDQEIRRLVTEAMSLLQLQVSHQHDQSQRASIYSL